MHACLRPLLSNDPRSTVNSGNACWQPLLSNGWINTQQWVAHATVEESKEVFSLWSVDGLYSSATEPVS
jgi:hypothetical protein